MKSEERHHLAENDLEQTLNRWLEKIEPYSNHILGGILLMTALAVGGILWKRTAQATADEGWTLFSDAKSADDFLRVAETFPDSNAADWASLRAARMLYDRAVEVSLTDRAASDADFLQAKELFEKLLKANVTKEVREGALDGLARCLESTSAGDTSEAIKAYETLVSEFPNSIYKDYAQHRIDVLKKPEATEFYAWFRKQNPKPADRPKPNDSGAASGLTIPGLPELPFDTNTSATQEPGDKTTEAPATAESTSAELPPAETTAPAAESAAPATEPEGNSEPETKSAPEGEAPSETPPASEPAPPADPAPETASEPAADSTPETPPPSGQ